MKLRIYQLLFICAFLFVGLTTSWAHDGDITFQSSQLHEIRLTFWQPAFWDSLLATHTNDTTMPCLVNIDGVDIDTIGVKLKGNSSFNSYPGVKKSFKLSFDQYIDTNQYDGLHSLNLNNGFKDPTMLREKVMLDFLRSQGLPAPRCTFAKLYLNGSYWGLYSMVEEVDKVFVNDLIGNKDGNLFKGDPSGNLQWYGSEDSLYYTKYELHTNDSLNDWSDLVHLIDVINHAGSSLVDSLEPILNTGNTLGIWATDLLFANLDSYTGTGHNYYLYHNTASGKFERIAWDANEAFGTFSMGMSIAQLEDLSYNYIPQPSNSSRPLNIQMLANATYRKRLTDRLCFLIQNPFSAENLNPRIDSLANSIRTAYYADPNKMFTNQNFDDNLEHDVTITNIPGINQLAGLKSFIANRRQKMMIQLAGLGCVYSGDEEHVQVQQKIELGPNPCSKTAVLTLSSSSPCQLTLHNLVGQVVKTFDISASNEKYSLEDLSIGLYIWKAVFSNGDVGNGKLVIVE